MPNFVGCSTVIRSKMESVINRLWYAKSKWCLLLAPVSWVFVSIILLRRWFYRSGVFKTCRVDCPVIVVGNITVGGTGKTPLVIYLVNQLKQHGLKPGVIARGYGRSRSGVELVGVDSDVNAVGDEVKLIAEQTGCPVVVGQKRPLAAKFLLSNADCNVIISDDGLQHYALQRNLEIVVVDGKRRFGNRLCLPVGPLREPISRLGKVDYVVAKSSAQPGEVAMRLKLHSTFSLDRSRSQPLSEFSGMKVHAVAGIGNPQQFFDMLRDHKLDIIEHTFPDHHNYCLDDLKFAVSGPVLMTEKDAVKCRDFDLDNAWYVPLAVDLPDQMIDAIVQSIKE